MARTCFPTSDHDRFAGDYGIDLPQGRRVGRPLVQIPTQKAIDRRGEVERSLGRILDHGQAMFSPGRGCRGYSGRPRPLHVMADLADRRLVPGNASCIVFDVPNDFRTTQRDDVSSPTAPGSTRHRSPAVLAKE
jgi:hypothetical protein